MPIDDSIAWYQLDEGAGTLAADSAGSNNGTVNGGAAWEPAAQIGAGLILDGTDDYIDCGSGMATLTNGTVALWVNLSANGTYPMMVTRGGGLGTRWELAFNDNTRRPYYAAGAGVLIGDTVAVDLASWAHVVLTIDSAAGGVLYIDGVPVDTEATLTSFGNGNDSVLIGRRADGFFLPATIDDVRIFDRALSQTEVTELFEWRGDQVVRVGSDGGGSGHLRTGHQRRPYWWHSYVEQWLDELEDEEKRKARLAKEAADAEARFLQWHRGQQLRNAERARRIAEEADRQRKANEVFQAQTRAVLQAKEDERRQQDERVAAVLQRRDDRQDAARERELEEDRERRRKMVRNRRNPFGRRFEAAVRLAVEQGWKRKQ